MKREVMIGGTALGGSMRLGFDPASPSGDSASLVMTRRLPDGRFLVQPVQTDKPMSAMTTADLDRIADAQYKRMRRAMKRR